MPPAAPTDVRLPALSTKILHALLKPVGDFTSQKALEVRFADPETGEPPDQLPEAVLALYDHKPPLLFESPELKRHYALTDAGRRLQRQLAPVKAQQAIEDDEDARATTQPPKGRTPQKRSTGKPDPLAKARAAKAAKAAKATVTEPPAQEPTDESGDGL